MICPPALSRSCTVLSMPSVAQSDGPSVTNTHPVLLARQRPLPSNGLTLESKAFGRHSILAHRLRLWCAHSCVQAKRAVVLYHKAIETTPAPVRPYRSCWHYRPPRKEGTVDPRWKIQRVYSHRQLIGFQRTEHRHLRRMI